MVIDMETGTSSITIRIFKNCFKLINGYPNAKAFEPYREFLDIVIHESHVKKDESVSVVPVLRIGELQGVRRWDLTDLDEDETTCFEGMYESEPANGRYFLPVLGPTFVAAYSPDVTQTWGTHLNMQLEPGRQDMGSNPSTYPSKC